MKKLLFLLLLPIIAFSQVDNFSISNDNLVWQQIYNDSISIDNLVSSLKLTGKFSKVEIINNNIEFENRFNGDDLKLHGYRRWSDAIFLGESTECTGSIEFKNNRYRVTIFRMTATSPVDYSKNSVYEYLVKKGEFRTGTTFIKARQYYNSYLTELFKSKNVKTDW